MSMWARSAPEHAEAIAAIGSGGRSGGFSCEIPYVEAPRATPTPTLAVVEARIAAQLRAQAEALRHSAGPIGTPLYIARMAQADAYEDVARRLAE